MKPELKKALQTDFTAFVRQAFRTLEDEKLGRQKYLNYVCYEVDRFASGKTTRLIVNMPPRHLKTFIASICCTAFMLGVDPSIRMMIVTHHATLCRDIADKIREIMRASWYREIFPRTQIRKDRSGVTDFETTEHGAVYAWPIHGKFTGRGGDVIILDDPHDLDDAGHAEKIKETCDLYGKVRSRLNDSTRGRIMIVAHRIDENDLSGQLLARGPWRHVNLPFIATKRATYATGGEPWRRRKNELLRPDGFTKQDIAEFRASSRPDFETTYQQNPSPVLPTITPDCFGLFSSAPSHPNPIVVLSVDPGQKGGANNSFSVVQAWHRDENGHDLLLDQWRKQCEFDQLHAIVKRFVKRYRPSAVIIEMTAQGPSLASKLKLGSWARIIYVDPRGSKHHRLARHIDHILSGGIWLPADAQWLDDFFPELHKGTTGKYTDQIDAVTQYLDVMAGEPWLLPAPERAGRPHLAQESFPNFWSARVSPSPPNQSRQAPQGTAVALGSRFRSWPSR